MIGTLVIGIGSAVGITTYSTSGGIISIKHDHNMSLTTAPTPSSNSNGNIPVASGTQLYSYGTSKIVRTAVAAGVIVLALAALVLFFKISSWIRYHERLRRQRDLTATLQKEQLANSYEIAAWSDQPGQAPIWSSDAKSKKKRSKKERKDQLRDSKRGGANAYAVFEWEGKPA